MFRRIFMIRPPWRSAETRQSAEKGEAKSCARTKDIAKKTMNATDPNFTLHVIRLLNAWKGAQSVCLFIIQCSYE
jgi:hypothetical protein